MAAKFYESAFGLGSSIVILQYLYLSGSRIFDLDKYGLARYIFPFF